MTETNTTPEQPATPAPEAAPAGPAAPEQPAEPARQATGRPLFPPGRYGRRRESGRGPFNRALDLNQATTFNRAMKVNRVAMVVLTIAVVGVGAVAAGILSQRYGPGRPYDAVVERFYDITDDQVVVEFSVVVPDGEAAICAVRARNSDGAEVGREQVRIAPAGDSRTWVSHTLATNDRAVTGEVQRCWRDQ